MHRSQTWRTAVLHRPLGDLLELVAAAEAGLRTVKNNHDTNPLETKDWTQIALLKWWLYILLLPCWGRCCLSTRKHLVWNSPKMPGETSFTSNFLKISIRMESETSNIHDSWNLQYQANSWSTHTPWKIVNLNFDLYCFRIRDMALLAVWLVCVPYSLGFLEAYWLKAAIHPYNTKWILLLCQVTV